MSEITIVEPKERYRPFTHLLRKRWRFLLVVFVIAGWMIFWAWSRERSLEVARAEGTVTRLLQASAAEESRLKKFFYVRSIYVDELKNQNSEQMREFFDSEFEKIKTDYEARYGRALGGSGSAGASRHCIVLPRLELAACPHDEDDGVANKFLQKISDRPQKQITADELATQAEIYFPRWKHGIRDISMLMGEEPRRTQPIEVDHLVFVLSKPLVLRYNYPFQMLMALSAFLIFGLWSFQGSLVERQYLLECIDDSIKSYEGVIGFDKILRDLPMTIYKSMPHPPPVCLVYVQDVRDSEDEALWTVDCGYIQKTSRFLPSRRASRSSRQARGWRAQPVPVKHLKDALAGIFVDPSATVHRPQREKHGDIFVDRATIVARAIQDLQQCISRGRERLTFYRELGLKHLIATPIVSSKDEVYAVVGAMSFSWLPFSGPRKFDQRLLNFRCALVAQMIEREAELGILEEKRAAEHRLLERKERQLEIEAFSSRHWRRSIAGVSHQVKNLLLKVDRHSVASSLKDLTPEKRLPVELLFINHEDIRSRIHWLTYVTGEGAATRRQTECDLIGEVLHPALINAVLYHLCQSATLDLLVASGDGRPALFACFCALKRRSIWDGRETADDQRQAIDEALADCLAYLPADEPLLSIFRQLLVFIAREFAGADRRRIDEGQVTVYSGPSAVTARISQNLVQGCLEEILINALAAMSREYMENDDSGPPPHFSVRVSPQHDHAELRVVNSGSMIPLIDERASDPSPGDRAVQQSTGVGLRSTAHFLKEYLRLPKGVTPLETHILAKGKNEIIIRLPIVEEND